MEVFRFHRYGSIHIPGLMDSCHYLFSNHVIMVANYETFKVSPEQTLNFNQTRLPNSIELP